MCEIKLITTSQILSARQMDPRGVRMRLVVFPDGVVDGAGELHDGAFPARLHNHRGTSGLDPKQKKRIVINYTELWCK